jgi:hypothetical protein
MLCDKLHFVIDHLSALALELLAAPSQQQSGDQSADGTTGGLFDRSLARTSPPPPPPPGGTRCIDSRQQQQQHRKVVAYMLLLSFPYDQVTNKRICVHIWTYHHWHCAKHFRGTNCRQDEMKVVLEGGSSARVGVHDAAASTVSYCGCCYCPSPSAGLPLCDSPPPGHHPNHTDIT